MFLALLVGAVEMLCGLLACCAAAALVVRVVVRLIPKGSGDLGFCRSVGVMLLVTLITTALHLLVIAVWAVAYLLCGEARGFEDAFYLSAENYTALGYGDLLLSPRWRLLGPLEAINGLLLFGVSTAVVFAVLSRLIRKRLRRLDHEARQDAEE